MIGVTVWFIVGIVVVEKVDRKWGLRNPDGISLLMALIWPVSVLVSLVTYRFVANLMLYDIKTNKRGKNREKVVEKHGSKEPRNSR